MARNFSKVIGTGKSLMKLPARGRQLARKIPGQVPLGLGRVRSRPLIITLEVFAGVLIMSGVLLVLAYARLAQGPISLSFLVPTIEDSINRELADVTVRIDDFIAQRAPDETGMSFRLRNVRLLDKGGSVIAQAPAAAIGLSGRALLSGRIAAGSVDFIGPRLLLFFAPETGLSLTFSRDGAAPEAPGEVRQTPVDPQARKAAKGEGTKKPRALEPGIALIAPSTQINITRTLTTAFEQARRHENASSYLTRFGVKDAIVVFDQGERQSFWQVPDFAIDLEHRQKRSIILGEADISSAAGPWRFKFRTEQSQKQQRLTFTALVQDLIPTGLAANFPDVPALQAFTMPLDAETSLHLSTSGELLGAEAKLNLSAGRIVAPWDHKRPMVIDEGEIHVRYQAQNERLEILPSTIKWGQSRATVSGEFTPVETTDGTKSWAFRLRAGNSILAADEFGLPPVRVDRWEASGTWQPKAGRLDLARFVIAIGESSLELAGSVVDAPGSPAVRLTGNFSPMPLSVLKLIWPKFIASGAKEWVGERVTEGHLSGGKFEINLPAGMLDELRRGGDIPESAVQLEARARGLKIHYIEGLPPVVTEDALLRVEGRRFALDVPRGSVTVPSGGRIELDKGRFTVDDLRPDPEIGVVDFRMRSTARATLELLDQKPLEYIKAIGLKPEDIAGQTEGNFKIELPLKNDVTFAEVRLKGTAELNQARLTKAFGKVGIEGGAVVFNVTEKALEARGDILVNGVPALLSWQRIFGAPPDKQPDLRLTTLLDESSRGQLGLDVNHIVRGTVPAILSLRHGADGKPKYRVRADLGNADIVLANVGWRKPRGRSAILTFDIGEGTKGNTELQNFKIEGRTEGHEIGIEGWISLGPDAKPKAFYFPDFSFNLFTRMEIAGELNADRIWDVQAHGSAYDGRQFFESLFSAGDLVEDQAPPPDDYAGVNLTAKIGAVAGSFNTFVNDVSISMQKRKGALTALDVSGKLDGQSPIAVQLIKGEGKTRVIVAESEDAGSSFRLIGFYPRIEGGQASVQINLDAQGEASKTGVLWAKDFSVLGDRVVSEVLSTAVDDPTVRFGQRKKGQANKKARRQRIPFNQLRVPFSVGDGQFQLHDSYINGPQLGATLRGNVNFKTQQLELGGTYIPVYGLNSALGSIPIVGGLLVGRRGEGVLGITFAIKGAVSEPDVKVNPVSMVAPGILRQVFEYTGRSRESFDVDPPAQQDAPRRQKADEPKIYQD